MPGAIDSHMSKTVGRLRLTASNLSNVRRARFNPGPSPPSSTSPETHIFHLRRLPMLPQLTFFTSAINVLQDWNLAFYEPVALRLWMTVTSILPTQDAYWRDTGGGSTYRIRFKPGSCRESLGRLVWKSLPVERSSCMPPNFSSTPASGPHESNSTGYLPSWIPLQNNISWEDILLVSVFTLAWFIVFPSGRAPTRMCWDRYYNWRRRHRGRTVYVEQEPHLDPRHQFFCRVPLQLRVSQAPRALVLPRPTIRAILVYDVEKYDSVRFNIKGNTVQAPVILRFRTDKVYTAFKKPVRSSQSTDHVVEEECRTYCTCSFHIESIRRFNILRSTVGPLDQPKS
ncbi:hypothetical protein DAEQUDRAFT_98379 [Daedalea quercina L-15889]|uniref:Uncharacterized protein n=1 Tax=Daedalea quercina L-15889 TaxID=1314783 RepID=A0A165SD33_9APHY|nr:hypothetical protein DAEQUDRAFT_98379 [Daedalea quercina L-15889]